MSIPTKEEALKELAEIIYDSDWNINTDLGGGVGG